MNRFSSRGTTDELACGYADGTVRGPTIAGGTGGGDAGNVIPSFGLAEAAQPQQSTSSLLSHRSQRPFDASALCSQSVSASASRSLSDVAQIPWVVPVRGHLDSIARLMSGDQYIGRGSRQRKLEKSHFSNPYKVSEYGRENAIRLFEQFLDCKFRELHPDAFDRNGLNQRAPTTEQLNLLAEHRQELPCDDGSSADDGVPAKNSGWVGQG